MVITGRCDVKANAGLGLALASSATFGTSGSFATSLIRSGWTPAAAATVRICVAAVVLTIPAILQMRGQFSLLRKGVRAATGYGVIAVAAAQVCYFNAVEHLSVAVALLLEYSGILLVIGWLWVTRGHRPRRMTIAGSLVAIIGLTLVLDLLSDHHLDPVGIAWAIGAAVGLAVYFVMSANTDDGLPPLVFAWSGLAIAGVALLIADVAGALPVRAPRTSVLLAHAQVSWVLPVLGLSIVAAAFAYAAGIAGVRILGAKVASFVGLTEVLFAVVFAWVLLGQSLSLPQLLGGVLVIAGIALVRVDEYRAQVLEVPPAPSGHSYRRPAGRVEDLLPTRR
jgi:drug/metabolite transporter (DMT)-like permease